MQERAEGLNVYDDDHQLSLIIDHHINFFTFLFKVHRRFHNLTKDPPSLPLCFILQALRTSLEEGCSW